MVLFLSKFRYSFLLILFGWLVCINSLQGQNQKDNSFKASLRQELKIPDNPTLCRMKVSERIHQCNLMWSILTNGHFNQAELNNLVSELENLAQQQSNPDLTFHVALISLHKERYASLSNNEELSHFENLQIIARKLGKGWMLVEAKFLMSRFLFSIKRHEEGLMLLREAVELMEGGDEEQLPNKQLIIRDLASAYLQFGDFLINLLGRYDPGPGFVNISVFSNLPFFNIY